MTMMSPFSYSVRLSVRRLFLAAASLKNFPALWIKSAYLTRCSLSTTGGDVRVTNLTGEDNQVTSLHGDLTLESVDGCLEAQTQTGNISATFSRVPTTSALVARVASESGDIELKVEPEVSANVFLAGEEIHVDESFDAAFEDDEEEEDHRGDDDRDVKMANVNSNNDRSDNNDSTENKEEKLSLLQAGVKVGLSESDSVIHAVSKLGKVSLNKKEWFGAFKFGS